MSLSKTSTTKDYSKPTRIKNLYSGWWKKPKEIRNVKTIWRQNNYFRPKKKVSKTELMILILIELKIYKDLLEQQEENCCKYVGRVDNFHSKNYITY